MSNYTWKYIKQHPQEVKRLLGISCEHLEQLIEQGKMLHLVKIFKAGQERFRLRKHRYAEVLLTICGLVRLRKGGLILEIVKALNSEKTIEVIKHHSFGRDLPLVTSNTQ